MAATALDVETIGIGGDDHETFLTPTFQTIDETNGNTFVNDGNTLLYIKNSDGASAFTATIASERDCTQGYNHPVVVEVPLSSELVVGAFQVYRFNDPSTQKVTITYSAGSQGKLTVAVLKLST